MKHICLLTVILMLCITLAGCSDTKSKNDISVYVSPTTNNGDSFFTSEPPSSKLPHKEAQTPSVKFGANSKTVFTQNMQWKLAGGTFASEELTFTIPTAWKSCFDFELIETEISTHKLRSFKFFVTDPNSEHKALVYEVRCVSKDYIEEFGKDYGIPLGTSANGIYSYTGLPVEEDVPKGYANGEAFVEIANIILSSEFKIIITV